MNWQDIQESIQNCSQCQQLEGMLFAPFSSNWPDIPQPLSRAILFLSEAPPKDGGFWTIQPATAKQDDLREKLLPLLKLSSLSGNRGLDPFRDSGYFLLQSFPRSLRVSISNVKTDDLKQLLKHPVETHLKDQITFFSPVAILALGKPAAAAISLLFPRSSFAHTYETGDFKAVQGKIFSEPGQPMISATYLPSGNGRFWRKFWEAHIPTFVHHALALVS